MPDGSLGDGNIYRYSPELAAGVGVTKAAVYGWLEGRAMTLENLEACARELRVSPAHLCRGWSRE